MEIITFIFASLLVGIIYFALRTHLLMRKYRHLPGPPPSKFLFGLFGHTPDLLRGQQGDLLLKWAEEYGDIFTYRWLFTPRVSVTSPEYVKQVLVKHCDVYSKKLDLYDFLRPLLGEGLVTISDVEYHRQQRGLINEAFLYSNLKALVPIFREEGSILVEKWSKAAEESRATDIQYDLSQLTVDVIARTAFGDSFHTQTQDTETDPNNFFTLFRDLLNAFTTPTNVLRVVPYVRDIMPGNAKRDMNLAKLNQKTGEYVERKRQLHANGDTETRDLLDILVSVKDPETGATLSTQNLIDHAKTFLLAGHETSSTCLTWTLLLLGQNPEAEKKLAEEVQTVLGDRLPNAEDLEKLKYMNAVLKESLRIFPPVPTVVRKIEREDTFGTYVVPAGGGLTVSPYVLHHRSSLWKNAEKFDPERWLNETDEHRDSWIPFLNGPRNCIGSKFAMMEMKVILAMIVQRFAFRLEDPSIEYKRKTSITTRPDPAVRMIMRSRKQGLYG